MLQTAVNFCRGHVTLRVESAFPERVLNLCSARRIPFWDLRWESPICFTFTMARGSWHALRPLAQRLEAEIRVERREGLPYFLWRFRRRHALVAGLALCALLSGMFINCIQNMGSSWISSLNAEGYQLHYGAARSCGSLAFAVMAVVLGWAIERWGHPGLVGGMAVCGLICILVSVTLPRSRGGVRQPGRAPDQAAPTLSEGLRLLTRQREYLVVCVSGFLAMSGVAGVSSYFSAYLATLGASAPVVGVGNFTYAIAEAPFMLLYRHIAGRLPFRVLFTVCLLAHGLQCVLVGLSPNYACAIASMLLQGLSFGTLVPALQHYTASRIDPRYVSTAQLFSAAVSLSASMIFGSLLASTLSRWFPLPVTFLLISLVSFSGCALFFLYTARHRPGGRGAGQNR